MQKFAAFLFVLVCMLGLVGCSGTATRASQVQQTALQDDFTNAVPAEINDNIVQNCTNYSQSLGYQTGKIKKAVLLGEDKLTSVYCEEDMKQQLIDSSDIVVIFENIRCVVDAETEIVLGRIPFV